jgi:nitrogen fixation protein NifZ
VIGLGRFLLDQLSYEFNFPDAGIEVGIRDSELITIDEPWVESRFEFKEFVITQRDLAVGGEIRVARGSRGQILKVVRDTDPACYQVCFTDKVYQLSEAALSPAPVALVQEFLS